VHIATHKVHKKSLKTAIYAYLWLNQRLFENKSFNVRVFIFVLNPIFKVRNVHVKVRFVYKM